MNNLPIIVCNPLSGKLFVSVSQNFSSFYEVQILVKYPFQLIKNVLKVTLPFEQRLFSLTGYFVLNKEKEFVHYMKHYLIPGKICRNLNFVRYFAIDKLLILICNRHKIVYTTLV